MANLGRFWQIGQTRPSICEFGQFWGDSGQLSATLANLLRVWESCGSNSADFRAILTEFGRTRLLLTRCQPFSPFVADSALVWRLCVGLNFWQIKLWPVNISVGAGLRCENANAIRGDSHPHLRPDRQRQVAGSAFVDVPPHLATRCAEIDTSLAETVPSPSRLEPAPNRIRRGCCMMSPSLGRFRANCGRTGRVRGARCIWRVGAEVSCISLIRPQGSTAPHRHVVPEERSARAATGQPLRGLDGSASRTASGSYEWRTETRWQRRAPWRAGPSPTPLCMFAYARPCAATGAFESTTPPPTPGGLGIGRTRQR